MTPSLIQRLAEIRQLQGREPMPDPGVIAGFGPGTPASPPFTAPIRTEQDEFEADDSGEEDTQATEPVSPLVRVATPPSPPAPTPAPTPPPLELAVFDREAAYLGHGVTLNEREHRAVTTVVLKALQRVLKGQLQELRGLGPKPTRKPKLGHPETPAGAPAEAPPRRKRGRPRGSLLRGKP